MDTRIFFIFKFDWSLCFAYFSKRIPASQLQHSYSFSYTSLRAIILLLIANVLCKFLTTSGAHRGKFSVKKKNVLLKDSLKMELQMAVKNSAYFKKDHIMIPQ